MEGKVEHKFDMKPHEKNIEEYGRLCRERTNRSMIKNRQIQVLHSLAFSLAVAVLVLHDDNTTMLIPALTCLKGD